MEITLNEITSRFMNHLQSLILNPKGGVMEDHKVEFKRLQKEYNDSMQKNVNSEDFPPITLQMSQSFYDTWVWRTFDDIFSTFHGIRKSTANAMNELHRELNENRNHPLFLKNYNHYYDD